MRMPRVTTMLSGALLGIAAAGGMATAQPACKPYVPDTGPFYTSQNFPLVPTSPQSVTVGGYSITLQNGSVVVRQGSAANAPIVASVAVPSGLTAWYSFYGSGNRFLALDFHTYTTNASTPINYQPALVDLSAWSSGNAPLTGTRLDAMSNQSHQTQLHMLPSPGNGLGLFVWYGQSAQGIGQINGVQVYRSDTAKGLCPAPMTMTAATPVAATMTATSVQIFGPQSGPLSCAVPKGALTVTQKTLTFGTILTTATATQTVTLANPGTDCIAVSSIGASAHFKPNIASVASLAANGSTNVGITFMPGGTAGSWTETLPVTVNPSTLSTTLQASGTAVTPPRVTINLRLRPSTDAARFNLLIDGATKAANAGDGGSTGVQTVTPGTHTLSEVAAPGIDLTGYTVSNDCGGSSGDGKSATVTLAVGDSKTCTFTNLAPPRLTLSTSVLPTEDAGRFNLQIDGAIKLANAGNGATTGALVMTAGAHTVGETAGTATNLADYNVAFSGDCSGNSVTLAQGDNKHCTIVNRGRPWLTLTNAVRPAEDPGHFNLLIDGAIKAANAGDGGSTGDLRLTAGNHTVSETAGTGVSNLSAYVTTIACDNQGPTVSNTSATVGLTMGNNMHCRFTNLGPPRLTVTEAVPALGDAGRFNIQIDGTTRAANVGDGGSTGTVMSSVGSHTVGETAAAGTDATQYGVVITGDCNDAGGVALAQGDSKRCLITSNQIQLTPIIEYLLDN